MKHFYFGWIGKRKPYYHDTGINDTRLCWVIHSPNVDCISCEYIVISFECDRLIVFWSFFEIKRTFYDIFLAKLFNYIILLTAYLGFKGLLSNYLVICDKHFLKLAMWSNSMLQKKIVITYINRKKNFST